MGSKCVMKVSVLGVVLAGGQASRMNYVAKGLTQYQGKALLDYPLKALTGSASNIMINANHDVGAYQKWGYGVFCDSADCLDKGPLSGVYAALLQAQKLGVTHLMISPCDTPLVNTRVFEMLKQKAEIDADQVFYVESDSGIQPLHAILPVQGMAEKLRSYLDGQARVMHFYRQINAQSVYWKDEQDFLNINYLDQLV